jgi:hypothetical protein
MVFFFLFLGMEQKYGFKVSGLKSGVPSERQLFDPFVSLLRIVNIKLFNLLISLSVHCLLWGGF